jgi:ferritin-like metal-binding protein YciE
MSEITTPRDLFLHELGDILYVEEKLEQEILPKLMEEARSDVLRKGFEQHIGETRGHVENVEEVFSKLGEQPQAEECIGFLGLVREHDQLVEESAPDLVDLVVSGAAARTEHYEIAAYETLIGLARALGEKDVVPLLESNLKEEKKTRAEVEKAGKELGKELAKELSEA